MLGEKDVWQRGICAHKSEKAISCNEGVRTHEERDGTQSECEQGAVARKKAQVESLQEEPFMARHTGDIGRPESCAEKQCCATSPGEASVVRRVHRVVRTVDGTGGGILGLPRALERYLNAHVPRKIKMLRGFLWLRDVE